MVEKADVSRRGSSGSGAGSVTLELGPPMGVALQPPEAVLTTLPERV